MLAPCRMAAHRKWASLAVQLSVSRCEIQITYDIDCDNAIRWWRANRTRPGSDS